MGCAAVRTGDVLMIRDGRWRVLAATPHGTGTLVHAQGCGSANRAHRAAFLLSFEPCTQVPPQAPTVVSARRWRYAARHILSDATPSWWSLRSAVDAAFDVLPYQLAPVLALVRGEASRFLIADAVGLGKTVQAALMVAETLARWPDGRALVVCPAALREQWRDELLRRFHLEARILDSAAILHLARDLPPGINPWSIHNVIITSVDYVKRPEVARALESLVWDIAIFDEAHNLAGRSDRATAAHLIAGRARHVVLLTATPHSGDAETFARLCAIGALDNEPLVVFRRTRSAAGLRARPRIRFLHVRQTTEERRMHDALTAYVRLVWNRRDAAHGARLAMAVLMRRACSSPAALARSIERRIGHLETGASAEESQASLPFDVSDGEPDAVLACPGLAEAGTELRHLQNILECARGAAWAESKLAALRRLIRRIAEPTIVVTEYRDTLEQLAGGLGAAGTLTLHGGLTARERSDAVRQFTAGPGRLLVSTDAGSEGLNLQQRCRLVINLELPWMPRRLDQRAGRVDRIGQSRQVHVVNLVAGETCEETVLTRLAVRHLRAQETLIQLSALSEEDVATMALGGATLRLDRPMVPLPAQVVAAAAATDASDEAARIRTARAMRSAGKPSEASTLLADIRRRSMRCHTARCLWLVTSACSTTAGMTLWIATFGIQGLPADGRSQSRSALRTLLEPRRAILSVPAQHCIARLRAGLRESLAKACHVWIAREEAILRHIRDRHAGLSLALVQPGLFDRRTDRLAAAHNEPLDDAVCRCTDRLATLAEFAELRMEDPSCAFGIRLE